MVKCCEVFQANKEQRQANLKFFLPLYEGNNGIIFHAIPIADIPGQDMNKDPRWNESNNLLKSLYFE